jgi:hypothetical protein
MSSLPPWVLQARSVENPHQGPRFSHQRFSCLHVRHPIASNHARCDQQLQKLNDASSAPHPK